MLSLNRISSPAQLQLRQQTRRRVGLCFHILPSEGRGLCHREMPLAAQHGCELNVAAMKKHYMTCEILLGCRLALSAPHLSISIIGGGQGRGRTWNASVSTVAATKEQYLKEDSSYWYAENEL